MFLNIEESADDYERFLKLLVNTNTSFYAILMSQCLATALYRHLSDHLKQYCCFQNANVPFPTLSSKAENY